jgi:hypothetical protein
MRKTEKFLKTTIYLSGLTALLCGSAYADGFATAFTDTSQQQDHASLHQVLIDGNGQEQAITGFEPDTTPMVTINGKQYKADMGADSVEAGCTQDRRFCVTGANDAGYDSNGNAVKVKSIFLNSNDFGFQPNAANKKVSKADDSTYGAMKDSNGKWIQTDDGRLSTSNFTFDKDGHKQFVCAVYPAQDGRQKVGLCSNGSQAKLNVRRELLHRPEIHPWRSHFRRDQRL